MKSKTQRGRLANPFAKASQSPEDQISELVRHLARIAADNDYKELRKMSKPRYHRGKKKGPSHE